MALPVSSASLRASRALQFMHKCRQSSLRPPLLITTSRNSSTSTTPDTSHLHPSNFSKPLRNPNPNYTSTPGPAPPFEPAYLKPAWAYPDARPGFVPDPALKVTGWMWLKMLFGWQPPKPKVAPAKFNAINNPYRARKKWPPDFATLHPKQQFHFEKTYRRRAKMKWARPNWTRWTKLVQHSLITFTIIYFVFICEPTHGQGTPFDGFRVWFFGKMKNIGRLPEDVRGEMEKLENDARQNLEKRGDLPAR